MKIIYKLLALFLLVCVTGCRRYSDLASEGATGGYKDVVSGRLVLTDTVTQRVIDVPQSNKQLTISFKSRQDSINYIVSTKTDSEGYFQINSLNANNEYRIWYRETVGGKLYSGVTYTAVPGDSVTVRAGIAMTGQTGVLFHVTDPAGNPLTGVTICVSQSPTPSANNSCEGTNFSITSDAYGNQSQFNLATGIYYVYAHITIKEVLYRAKAQFTISDKVEKLSFKVEVPPVTASNGYEFLVTDMSGNPINGAAVCLYASRDLYERDTCEASNYTTISNTLGKAVISKIEPGKYYVIGNAAFTNFKMIARDVITVDDKVGYLNLKLEKF
jgi:hypothetical protein